MGSAASCKRCQVVCVMCSGSAVAPKRPSDPVVKVRAAPVRVSVMTTDAPAIGEKE